MFSRWGAFVYRFRRAVAILTVVLALASTALATQASSALSSGGWLDADSESADGLRAARHRVRRRQELGHRPLPRRRRPVRTPRPPRSRARSRQRSSGLAGDAARHGDRRLRRDRRRRASSAPTATPPTSSSSSTRPTRSRSTRSMRSAPRSCRRPATRYQLTGYGPITKDSAEQSEKDLQKAEMVSLPIVALILRRSSSPRSSRPGCRCSSPVSRSRAASRSSTSSRSRSR